MPEPLMNLREASHFLNVHRCTTIRLVAKGVLPCYRLGTSYRFSLSQLRKAMSPIALDS